MAKITELVTEQSGKVVNPHADSGGTSYYEEAIAPRSATGLDHSVASKRVGTGKDDTAFTVGTDPIAVIGGLADETGTDSVDEGDVGAIRMTLNRRLIIASLLLDDAAFGIGTDYVNLLGALADDTSPDSVNEGDAGAVRMTLARKLLVNQTADAATLSNVASSASNVTLLAAQPNRIGATIYNDSTAILYVKFGATASATSFVIAMAAASYYEFPNPVYRGIVDGIWASANGNARITELT